jgi:hypothetical protein
VAVANKVEHFSWLRMNMPVLHHRFLIYLLYYVNKSERERRSVMLKSATLRFSIGCSILLFAAILQLFFPGFLTLILILLPLGSVSGNGIGVPAI